VTSGSKYPALAWPPADVPDSVIRENLGEFDCVTKLFDPDVLVKTPPVPKLLNLVLPIVLNR